MTILLISRILYGFDFSGIKQNEKILNTDIRKVMVTIKQAYTSQIVLNDIEAFYRVYVREGNTEVQVQDWTPINRTPNEYYFIFDTRDKIQKFVTSSTNCRGDGLRWIIENIPPDESEDFFYFQNFT